MQNSFESSLVDGASEPVGSNSTYADTGILLLIELLLGISQMFKQKCDLIALDSGLNESYTKL